MTTIYVVAGVKPGYCREDSGVENVTGAWTDRKDADAARRSVGCLGTYTVFPVNIDETPAGIRSFAKELFNYEFKK
jgi:hypothetical protein